MKNVEVEIRSFIKKDQYKKLLDFFKKNAKFINEDYQETYYFDREGFLRIQRNNLFSKIWIKKGRIHDDYKEEIEIKFERKDFKKVEKLFKLLGFKVQVKWFRKRYAFEWKDLNVYLDHTKGYGYIIELEKICSEKDKEKTLEFIKKKLKELGVQITPKEVFDKKYNFYLNNWKKIIA